jgi:hypothetical protein
VRSSGRATDLDTRNVAARMRGCRLDAWSLAATTSSCESTFKSPTNLLRVTSG